MMGIRDGIDGRTVEVIKCLADHIEEIQARLSKIERRMDLTPEGIGDYDEQCDHCSRVFDMEVEDRFDGDRDGRVYCGDCIPVLRARQAAEAPTPMTPEEEWAEAALEGEWEKQPVWFASVRFQRNTQDGYASICRDGSAQWRVYWSGDGKSGWRDAPTLREALATAREHAPADLLPYLYPRDEWRRFGTREPEVGQWIEVRDCPHGALCYCGSTTEPASTCCRDSGDCYDFNALDEWRPADPPEGDDTAQDTPAPREPSDCVEADAAPRLYTEQEMRTRINDALDALRTVSGYDEQHQERITRVCKILRGEAGE